MNSHSGIVTPCCHTQGVVPLQPKHICIRSLSKSTHGCRTHPSIGHTGLLRGRKTPEAFVRVVRPRDLQFCERSSKNIGAQVQIPHTVPKAASATPFVGEIIAVMPRDERKSMGMFKTVPFAGGQGKLGNP